MRRHPWVTMALTLLVSFSAVMVRGTTLAQGQIPSSTEGPPSVGFIVGLAAVFVAIIVAFLVFARSQGCDTTQEKKQEWN